MKKVPEGVVEVVSPQHAKVIRRLVIGQIVTLVLAILAGGLAVGALADTLSNVQSTRVTGRHDSCVLLKGLAFRAAGAEHKRAVKLYISHTPLANCDHYAHSSR